MAGQRSRPIDQRANLVVRAPADLHARLVERELVVFGIETLAFYKGVVRSIKIAPRRPTRRAWNLQALLWRMAQAKTARRLARVLRLLPVAAWRNMSVCPQIT